jgi:Ca2+-transporting ATPase
MKIATIVGVLIPRSLVKTFPSTSPNSTVNTVLSPSLLTLCNKAIAVNSTAFEDDEKDTGERVCVGSKTETAILNFTKELGRPNYKETKDAAQTIQIIPFSGERKAMGTVVKLAHGYRLYVKGASEILTKLCRWHVVVHQQGGPADRGDVELAEIDNFSEENITRTIISTWIRPCVLLRYVARSKKKIT